jgi:GTP cyclohydrolase I
MEQLLATELPALALVVIAGVIVIERVIGAFSKRLQSRENVITAVVEQLNQHDEISIIIRRKKRE